MIIAVGLAVIAVLALIGALADADSPFERAMRPAPGARYQHRRETMSATGAAAPTPVTGSQGAAGDG